MFCFISDIQSADGDRVLERVNKFEVDAGEDARESVVRAVISGLFMMYPGPNRHPVDPRTVSRGRKGSRN